MRGVIIQVRGFVPSEELLSGSNRLGEGCGQEDITCLAGLYVIRHGPLNARRSSCRWLVNPSGTPSSIARLYSREDGSAIFLYLVQSLGQLKFPSPEAFQG